MSRNTNLDKLRTLRSHNQIETRLYNLALGLIRGRTLDRIESKNSNPHRFPDPTSLVNLTMAFYRPIAEGQDQSLYESEKQAFRAKLLSDLTVWKKQLHLNWLTLEAARRKRNAIKRATPRLTSSIREVA